MRNRKIYIWSVLLIVSFCIPNNVLGDKKSNFRPIISKKATFIPLDDTGISNVSHNGNIVVGDLSVLPMIYRLFIPYDKQLPFTKYRPFTFSLSDKKFEFWDQLTTDVMVRAVSDDGEVIVGSQNSFAFRWTKQTGIVKLPFSLPGDVNMTLAIAKSGFPIKDINSAQATDISADGSVVVGCCNHEAFLWTEEMGMIGLGCLHGAEFCESRATAVSADGKTVIGVSTSSHRWEAFRWTKSEGMVGLEVPYPQEKGFGNEATGVSADGSVIVGRRGNAKSGDRPFYWTKVAGIVELDDINGFDSKPSAVSDDGRIIVGWSHKKNCKTPVECGLPEAFIWTVEKGIRSLKSMLITDYNLPLEKWKLTEARAISGDGTIIVGNGRNPDGREIGWIVKFKKD